MIAGIYKAHERIIDDACRQLILDQGRNEDWNRAHKDATKAIKKPSGYENI